MQSDRAIGRYRRWYARLLRLYPRPFQERFGEPMAQTFADLCRERSDANRELHAFALGTFAETTAQIMRENMTQLMQTGNCLRWVLVTAAVLAVPALGMVFNIGIPDPGAGTEGVNWGPMDFAIMGVLVLGSGLLYEYASRRSGTVAHRAAVGIAVAAGLFLIWVNLAVGMIGDEGNAANLMYIFVLFVALVGASIARFEPREASIAMFATAGAQALVAVTALIAGLGPTVLADVFFIGAWVASGLLFRQASVAAPAA
ncbi:MAG: hypothetical protein M3153_07315 [Chloroflexota bacterium]|nr:hypothetical protein [Chloroflexota bacterium]